MFSVKVYINKVLHLFELVRVRTKEKVVYLTFDDGPEPGITEFVLNELEKYDFCGTFFCRGDNAKKYPSLLKQITNKGHAIGNHTYSHLNSFHTSKQFYIEDVEKADKVLHTKLFRPPWGSITLSSFLALGKKYRIVYWSLVSGDAQDANFQKNQLMNRLKSNTKAGDIVLFHFSCEHENRTRQLLPEYLLWLNDHNFQCKSID